MNITLKILIRGKYIKILYFLIFLFLLISFFLISKISNIINSYHILLNESILKPFGILELTIKNDINKAIKLLKNYDIMVYTSKNYEVKLSSKDKTQIKNVTIIISNINDNYLSPLLYSQFKDNVNLQINKKTKKIHFKYIQTGILYDKNIIFLSKENAKYYNLPTIYNKINIRNINIDQIEKVKNNIKHILIKNAISFKIKDLLKNYNTKKLLLKKMENIQQYTKFIFTFLISLFISLVFIIIFHIKKNSFLNLIYLGESFVKILNTYMLMILLIFITSFFISFTLLNVQMITILKIFCYIFIIIYILLYLYIRKIS